MQVIAWMRKRYSKDLVFVMCTARSHVESCELATIAGAQGFLCKPYTMKDLLELLANIPATQQIIGLNSESAVETLSESEASRAQGHDHLGKQEMAQGILNSGVSVGVCIACHSRCNVTLCDMELVTTA